MYDAVTDKYCYPGTHVLKNLPGLRRQAKLRSFELAMTTQRLDEPLPHGRFSVSHYHAIYHHLFQDVYPWAGKFRTVRIAKDRSSFCYPENIAGEMRRLFHGLKRKKGLRGLTAEQFATDATHFLAELNAIHPFRDGNGRASWPSWRCLPILPDTRLISLSSDRGSSSTQWWRVSSETKRRWKGRFVVS